MQNPGARNKRSMNIMSRVGWDPCRGWLVRTAYVIIRALLEHLGASAQGSHNSRECPFLPHSNPSFLPFFFSFSPPKPCSALHDFLSNATSPASAQFQTQTASVLSSSRAFSSKLLPSPISPSKQPCLLGKGRQNCVILIILELPWWPRQ